MPKAYDAAIIGAGPVGCLTALALEEKGRRVLLLEANPKAAERLAGEWLHPPAYEALTKLGVDLMPTAAYESGRGFAVFPDDGSEPIVLPYQAGSYGFAVEHCVLVDRLRQRCEARANRIEYVPFAKATRITGQNLTYQSRTGKSTTVMADLIIGASGRASIAHDALGIERNITSYSRMAGLLLEDAEMPFEGFGHVLLGGPGPVLAYRISDTHVRVCLDVPLSIPVNRNKEAVLWDGFARVMPDGLRGAFRRALESGKISWAANQIRPRVEFGREGLVLVGDAVGHHHPLTAVGMTLGFRDALALAERKSFASYRRERVLETRVPEMLAIALYEVFADPSHETVHIRRAVYDMWRRSPVERMRTMSFLAGQNRNGLAFGWSFLSAVAGCSRNLVGEGLATGHWDHVKEVTGELGARIRWMVTGALHLASPEPTRDLAAVVAEQFGGALKMSMPKGEVVDHPSLFDARRSRDRAPHDALRMGLLALEAHQADEGSWEGEVVWCPMLAAQYVMMCHILDRPIGDERRRRVLKQFEKTRLADGTWGLFETTEQELLVTTLVYIAARLLEVPEHDSLIARAGELIRREGGASRIPSWGRFWLAMLNLYEWRGTHPVLPEAWMLPRWSPFHPSRYYCHTRMIYLGMALIYGSRFQSHCMPLHRSLRRELFPEGWENVDFEERRNEGRLRPAFDAMRALEKLRSKRSREKVLSELREHIRYELRSSSHSSLSPVSGLLNIIALWLADPEDEDLARALERFEGWIWEDDVDGLRVAAARTATWDTSLAVQALVEAAPHYDVERMLDRADRFLAENQIRDGVEEVSIQRARGSRQAARAVGEIHHRLDPTGGFCFAGGWHGWPASDATAEALIARLANPHSEATIESEERAIHFILRCQNGDGGFGSYEARRVEIPAGVGIPREWMNPAEMLGYSMTEHSSVECTASCATALRTFRERHPNALRSEIDGAMALAGQRIRSMQHPDGSWEGNFGVDFIYGTMLGIRGLLASGAPAQDPAIRRAASFLLSKQRPDGGWGEKKSSRSKEFVEADSHVVQTAWALAGLLESKEMNWDAIERGATHLADKQLDNGEWPKQEPVALFFRTGLVDYTLYRSYFPIRALALYETRRLERSDLVEGTRVAVST